MPTMMNMRRGILAAGKPSTVHKYWRLRFTGTLDPAATGKVVGFAEVQMRPVAAVGYTMTALGVASASTENGVFTADKGIDGSAINGWKSGADVWDQSWWRMNFDTPQVVKELYLRAYSTTANSASMPSGFVLEWSNNNTVWTPQLTVTGQTLWANQEIRLFAVPQT